MYTHKFNFKTALILPLLLFCFSMGGWAQPFTNISAGSGPYCVGQTFNVTFDLNSSDGFGTAPGTDYTIGINTTSTGSPNPTAQIGAATNNTQTSGTVSIPCSIATPGTYYVEVSSTNPTHTNHYSSGTITVNPNPTAIITQPQNPASACVGGQATIAVTPGAPSGGDVYTYTWAYSTDDTHWIQITADNMPTGFAYAGSETTTTLTVTSSGTNSPGPYYFQFAEVSTLYGCNTFSNPVTWTLVAQPSSGILTPTPANSTVCTDGTVVFNISPTGGTPYLTYLWQYDTLGGNSWSNISPGQGSPSNAQYDTTGGELQVGGFNFPGGYQYRCMVSATGSGCNSSTGPAVTATVVSQVTPANPTADTSVCAGNNDTLMVTSTGGTGAYTYQWFYSANAWAGDSTPVANLSSSDNYTLHGDTLLTGYYWCNIAPALIGGGSGCQPVTSDSVHITVHSAPVFSTQPTSPAPICTGGTTTGMTVAATGATSYQWQYDSAGTGIWKNVSTNLPSGASYTNGSSATSTPFSISGINVAGNYKYRCEVSTNGCGAVSSDTITLSVVAKPTITQQPLAPSPICIGGSASFSVAATNGTPLLTYQWQDSTSSGWGNITNATNSSLTATGISTTTGYRAIISASGSGCGSVPSSSVTVIPATQPTITQQPVTPSPICEGGGANFSITATGGTPSLAYQWQDSSSLGWANITNATNAALNVTNIIGTTGYRCVISAGGGGCSSAPSSSATLVVVQLPTVTQQPATPSPICTGGSASFSVAATGGTPALTYQWQSNNGSGWSYITDSTNTTLHTGAVTSTTSYNCLVMASGSGCTTVTSNPAILTVAAQPSFSGGPSATLPTICTTGSSSISISATGGTPVLTYQWQDSSVHGHWANVGTNSSTYPTGSLNNTEFYRCIISATGSGCVSATSSFDSVTVVPNTAGTNIVVTNSTVCVGINTTTLTETPAQLGASTVSYNWLLNGTAVSGPNYSGQGTNTLTATDFGATGNQQFTCQIIPNPIAGNGCTTQSELATIDVIQRPAITQPAFTNPVICTSGTNTATAMVSGGNGTIQYQWQYNNGSNWVNVTHDQPDTVTYTVTNNVDTSHLEISGDTVVGNPAYRLIVTQSTSGCIDTSASASFSVQTGPSLVVTNPFAAICVGGSSSAMVSASGGHGVNSYHWQYSSNGTTWSPVGNGTPSGAVYTGDTASTLNVDGINAYGRYFYQCVLSQYGGSACTAVSSTLILAVDSNPYIITAPAVSPSTICTTGSASVALSASGGTPLLKYQWMDSTSSGWANIAGATSRSLAIGNLNNAGNYPYKCTISATGSGCTSTTSNEVVLTVVPQITTTIPVATAICKGGVTGLSLTASNGILPLSYQWQYSSTGATGTWADVINGTPNGVTAYATYTITSGDSLSIATNNLIDSGTYQYRCYVSSAGSGCATDSGQAGSITIEPDPYVILQPSLDSTAICPGGAVNFSVDAAGGAPSLVYAWQYITPESSVFTTVPGGGTNNLIVNNLTSPLGNYYYRCQISDPASGCTTVYTDTSVITVVANPSVTAITAPAPICADGHATITVSAIGGTPSLSYQWQYNSNGTWQNISNLPQNVIYSGGASNSLSFSSNGTVAIGSYSYRCVVSAPGSAGCAAFNDSTAVITVMPLPPLPSFKSQFMPICLGSKDVPMLLDSADLTNGLYSFVWSSGPGALAGTGLTTPYPTFDFTNSSHVTIYVTDKTIASGCTNTDSLAVAVNSSSSFPNDIVSALQSGDTVLVLIVDDNTAASYQWGFDSTNLIPVNIPNATFQTYNLATPFDTSYHYWVTVCDSAGCCSKIYYNNPGNNVTTSISNLTGVAGMRVYPNPTSDVLNIEATGSLNIVQVSIYDLSGKLAQIRNQLNSAGTTLNLANIQSGIYICEVVFENNVKARVKIAVAK